MDTLTTDTDSSRTNSPDQGELQMTMHGLHGIFWALNMLVVHHAADDIAHERDRVDGIEGLIVAGKRLTEEVVGRF